MTVKALVAVGSVALAVYCGISAYQVTRQPMGAVSASTSLPKGAKTIAGVFQIELCRDLSIPDSECPDGRVNVSVSIMIKSGDDLYVVWIERDGKPVYWQKLTGETWTVTGLNPSKAGVAMWMALASSSQAVCEIINQQKIDKFKLPSERQI